MIKNVHRRRSWLTASNERVDRCWSGEKRSRRNIYPQKLQPCCRRWLYHYSISKANFDTTTGGEEHTCASPRTVTFIHKTAMSHYEGDRQVGNDKGGRQADRIQMQKLRKLLASPVTVPTRNQWPLKSPNNSNQQRYDPSMIEDRMERISSYLVQTCLMKQKRKSCLHWSG